jgi:hypothetical protein
MVVPRRQDNGIMRRIPSLLSSTTMRLLVVAIVLPFTGSQTIGVDICACSPSVYTFELSFLLNCSMQTVKDNPGVQDAECRVSGLRPEDNVTDLVPVKVSTVEILELGAEQQVIQSGFYDQGYFDLATISYTSITGSPDALNLTVDQIPRGLQINIIGQNANEEDILNYWIVLFTNQCNAFPVFEIGDMIGWTVIVRIVTSCSINRYCGHGHSSCAMHYFFSQRGLDNPLAFFCPPASEAPTSSPAPSATVMPSPTDSPTSIQPTPCVPKDSAPFTSTAPASSQTTEPSFYLSHHGKGSTGKGGMSGKGSGKGGSMRLRDLKVWNDDVVPTLAPTTCVEPDPPTSKSKKSSPKHKSSTKKSAKKKDPSKSSPSKSKVHQSKKSKAKGSPKRKYTTKRSSKGSPSKGGIIIAPTRNPDAAATAAPLSSLPPAAPSPTTSNVQLPPSYPNAAPSSVTIDSPSSGSTTTAPNQPTPKPTRFPTNEPTSVSV